MILNIYSFIKNRYFHEKIEINSLICYLFDLKMNINFIVVALLLVGILENADASLKKVLKCSACLTWCGYTTLKTADASKCVCIAKYCHRV